MTFLGIAFVLLVIAIFLEIFKVALELTHFLLVGAVIAFAVAVVLALLGRGDRIG